MISSLLKAGLWSVAATVATFVSAQAWNGPAMLSSSSSVQLIAEGSFEPWQMGTQQSPPSDRTPSETLPSPPADAKQMGTQRSGEFEPWQMKKENSGSFEPWQMGTQGTAQPAPQSPPPPPQPR